ncbi:hypothetical protein QLQ80_03065 [Mycoplasma sp. M5725]|uniref:Uncharacterized protein n=1 Tax=Mycoplasma phocimorsus TaxID=3045839 RepID=A0AAJ1PT55_9MOLU|nr:hypothetical protein [Mycoplasma phocimorsus]MDJ1646044.1 hypothetical protein [Mycoplasma phocimorsus]
MNVLFIFFLVLIFGFVISSLIVIKFKKNLLAQGICFFSAVIISFLISFYFSEFKLIDSSSIQLFRLINYISSMNTFIISIFLFLSFIYVILVIITSTFSMFKTRAVISSKWIKILINNFIFIIISIITLLFVYLLRPRAFDSFYMHVSSNNIFIQKANFSNNILLIINYLTSFYKLIEMWQTSVFILFAYLFSILIGYVIYKLNNEKIYSRLKTTSINITQFNIIFIYFAGYLSIIEICLKSFLGFIWRTFTLIFAFIIILLFLKLIAVVFYKKFIKLNKELKLNTDAKNIGIIPKITLYKNTIFIILTVGFLMLCNWENEAAIFTRWYIYLTLIISLILTSGIYLEKEIELSLVRYGNINSVINITNGSTTASFSFIFSLFDNLISKYLKQIFNT